MTELPNEWIDKASDISNTKLNGSTNERQLGYEDGFTDGATAYKQTVEKLLSDRQKELLADKKDAVGEEEQTQYNLLIVEIAFFLKALQTLTPTSND